MARKTAWYSVRWPIAVVLRFMAIGKQAWLDGLAKETCFRIETNEPNLLMGKFGSFVYDGLCSPFDSYSMTT